MNSQSFYPKISNVIIIILSWSLCVSRSDSCIKNDSFFNNDFEWTPRFWQFLSRTRSVLSEIYLQLFLMFTSQVWQRHKYFRINDINQLQCIFYIVNIKFVWMQNFWNIWAHEKYDLTVQIAKGNYDCCTINMHFPLDRVSLIQTELKYQTEPNIWFFALKITWKRLSNIVRWKTITGFILYTVNKERKIIFEFQYSWMISPI